MCKPIKPPRTFLEPHEAQAVLDAGGKYRSLLATMMLAGLLAAAAASVS